MAAYFIALWTFESLARYLVAGGASNVVEVLEGDCAIQGQRWAP
jgi:hypothetical protein